MLSQQSTLLQKSTAVLGSHVIAMHPAIAVRINPNRANTEYSGTFLFPCGLSLQAPTDLLASRAVKNCRVFVVTHILGPTLWRRQRSVCSCLGSLFGEPILVQIELNLTYSTPESRRWE